MEKNASNMQPTINVNSVDQDESTALVIALKNRHLDICRFLLKYHGEKMDLTIKSAKLGNAISLAMKNQEFDIIEYVLCHKQVTSKDSYILNYLIPYFEKKPTENAKYIVKLILEQGMDPNYLREKFLKKDHLSLMEEADRKELNQLPDKILDTSPISCAVMNYQNNALNFIIKYNNTIREILNVNNKVNHLKQ